MTCCQPVISMLNGLWHMGAAGSWQCSVGIPGRRRVTCSGLMSAWRATPAQDQDLEVTGDLLDTGSRRGVVNGFIFHPQWVGPVNWGLLHKDNRAGSEHHTMSHHTSYLLKSLTETTSVETGQHGEWRAYSSSAQQCITSTIQIGPRWKRHWEDSTITEKGEGKCCSRALKAARGVEIVSVVRICAPKKWVVGTLMPSPKYRWKVHG